MRIIAGSLGGRAFQSPNTHRTHPMSDKVRGAIFNMLGDIAGLSVLDAFAGSGALSLEAISRGATHAIAIDIDKRAAATVAQNVRELGIQKQIKAIRANASSWSDNNPHATFDLVFVAPPYDDLQPQLVHKLVRHVAPEGILVLDWPGGQAFPELSGFTTAATKLYGDASIAFYQRA